jgi:hypothetical protein
MWMRFIVFHLFSVSGMHDFLKFESTCNSSLGFCTTILTSIFHTASAHRRRL